MGRQRSTTEAKLTLLCQTNLGIGVDSLAVRMAPEIRHAVRVLLVDEEDRLLLFRAINPGTGRAFWFPVGGGMENGEDPRETATREVAEETGLTDLVLGPEVWQRRHVFAWRGKEFDQRERWFLARVRHFEPDRSGMTEEETADLTAHRWWSLAEMRTTEDDLVPRDLANQLHAPLTNGPPGTPITIGV